MKLTGWAYERQTHLIHMAIIKQRLYLNIAIIVQERALSIGRYQFAINIYFEKKRKIRFLLRCTCLKVLSYWFVCSPSTICLFFFAKDSLQLALTMSLKNRDCYLSYVCLIITGDHYCDHLWQHFSSASSAFSFRNPVKGQSLNHQSVYVLRIPMPGTNHARKKEIVIWHKYV